MTKNLLEGSKIGTNVLACPDCGVHLNRVVNCGSMERHSCDNCNWWGFRPYGFMQKHLNTTKCTKDRPTQGQDDPKTTNTS